MAGNEALNSPHQAVSRAGESATHANDTSVTPEVATPTPPTTISSQVDRNGIAYELLLLQQRLAAYERLHQEEMSELRREIERLSRAFLHQTLPLQARTTSH